jgi:hypothetical protein
MTDSKSGSDIIRSLNEAYLYDVNEEHPFKWNPGYRERDRERRRKNKVKRGEGGGSGQLDKNYDSDTGTTPTTTRVGGKVTSKNRSVFARKGGKAGWMNVGPDGKVVKGSWTQESDPSGQVVRQAARRHDQLVDKKSATKPSKSGGNSSSGSVSPGDANAILRRSKDINGGRSSGSSSKPATKPATKPPTKPATEPATKPATKPPTKPATKPTPTRKPQSKNMDDNYRTWAKTHPTLAKKVKPGQAGYDAINSKPKPSTKPESGEGRQALRMPTPAAKPSTPKKGSMAAALAAPLPKYKPKNSVKESTMKDYSQMADAYRKVYEAADKKHTVVMPGRPVARPLVVNKTHVSVDVTEPYIGPGGVEKAYYTYPAGFDPTNREDVMKSGKGSKNEGVETSELEIIGDYLLESGYVAEAEAVDVFFNHMSEEWKEEIIEEQKKKGRCWTGYKPVPGKKPYSDGSCEKA